MDIKDSLAKFRQDSDTEAFETFARLHPLEAYDQNPQRFCEFVRRKTGNGSLTNDEIKTMIDECC